jgi:hypothetical protein
LGIDHLLICADFYSSGLCNSRLERHSRNKSAPTIIGGKPAAGLAFTRQSLLSFWLRFLRTRFEVGGHDPVPFARPRVESEIPFDRLSPRPRGADSSSVRFKIFDPAGKAFVIDQITSAVETAVPNGTTEKFAVKFIQNETRLRQW